MKHSAPFSFPPLGVGTVAWGDRFGAYGRDFTVQDVRAAFEASLLCGVTLFDTAEIYTLGRSERLLGQLVRQSGAHALVASKFMPFPWRLQRRQLLSALRASLGRLGLPAVDLYQLHWPLPPVAPERWADGLADAVELGLARAVGISNCNAEQTRRVFEVLARRGVPLLSNQVEYSLVQRAPERNGLATTCRELGVALIAHSPLARGLLTGKYGPDRPPRGVRALRLPRRLLADIQPLTALLAQIGEAHGCRTPAQVALTWLVCKGAVPIPGAKNARQARDNAGALGWRLTDDEIERLDRASDACRPAR